MNRNRKIFTFALFILMMLSTGVTFLSPVEEVGGEDSEAETASLHVNLKSGEELSSETQAPDAQAEVMWVQANVNNYGAVIQKDWGDVATWRSTSRERMFSFGGNVAFNIWYSLRDEGHDGGPEFRFTISVDGQQVSQITGPQGEDNDDDTIFEYKATGTFDPIELPPDAELSLKLEYRSFEDCDLYYDNATYDSGMFAESDFCKFFSYSGKGDKIDIEVYDAWGADWDKVGSYVVISIDGQETSFSGFITREGQTYEDDVQSTLIQYTLEEGLVEGQTVSIWVKYSPSPGETPGDRGFEKSFEVGAGGGGGGGGDGGSSGGDDEDDDANNIIIFGAIGGVVAAGAIGGFVFMKKRGEGDEDEEEYDEDEEDEDEDYDEEDEMDYE